MATSLRILVAEDDPLSAMALHAQLEVIGHQVVGVANTGVEAVKLAGERQPQLAILDVRMPFMSGLDAAKEIIALRTIPIIFLTGLTDSGINAAAAELPVAQVLVKPVSMDELGPAIKRIWQRFVKQYPEHDIDE